MPRKPFSALTLALTSLVLPLHAAASEPHTESASAPLADLRQPVGLLSNTSLTLAPSALAHRSDLQPGQGLLGGQSFGRDATGSDPGTRKLMGVSKPELRTNLLPNRPSPPRYRAWMHQEVAEAWSKGYQGQDTRIYVIDDFKGVGGNMSGNLTGNWDFKTHGDWTQQQASMVAPKARMRGLHNSGNGVKLDSGMRNVINLSYGTMSKDNHTQNGNISKLDRTDRDVYYIARGGDAAVVQAAGNDGITMGSRDKNGRIDVLSSALRHASLSSVNSAVIFVGALEKNGSTKSRAKMASYSNRAGADAVYQKRFLVVGVDAQQMGGLEGTSFAAPIVSGYAAILNSKFKSARSNAITNQLLNTARKDTVANYDVRVHGQGEASLSRALAPKSIR